jgi:ABC-type transport system substrate-binding protein
MATPNFKMALLMAALGVSMLGCTGKDMRSLKILFPAVKANLDPQQMEDAFSMAVVGQIYRGLLRYNSNGDVLPDLAESWTESPDHLSYVFRLKKGTFSNGEPIMAQNVQMTFARMFRLGASMAADIEYIAGARTFKASHKISDFGVKVIDQGTVEFRLEKPSAIFLKQLAVVDCSILPISDFSQELTVSAAGAFSGPYKLVTPEAGATFTLERWRSDPLDSKSPPERISYTMMDRNAVDAALAGETDSLDHVAVGVNDRTKLKGLGWESSPTELAGEVFLVLNPKAIPEPARRLMYASVDPALILLRIKRDSYKPAFGLIPFGYPGELAAGDVADLKKMKLSPLKTKLTLTLDFEGTSELERGIVAELKRAWAPLNIEITENPLTKGEKLQRLFGKKSQIILGKKGTDYPDGFSVLGYFKGNYESNYFFVNDPVIDRSLLEALEIFDADKREREYQEIQKRILAHHTLIPLFFGSEASGLWSHKVKFVPSHPLGSHTLPMETVEVGSR